MSAPKDGLLARAAVGERNDKLDTALDRRLSGFHNEQAMHISHKGFEEADTPLRERGAAHLQESRAKLRVGALVRLGLVEHLRKRRAHGVRGGEVGLGHVPTVSSRILSFFSVRPPVVDVPLFVDL